MIAGLPLGTWILMALAVLPGIALVVGGYRVHREGDAGVGEGDAGAAKGAGDGEGDAGDGEGDAGDERSPRPDPNRRPKAAQDAVRQDAGR